MHLVEIVKENPLGIGLGRYLAEDVNAGEMLASGWCKVLGNGAAALHSGSVRAFAAKRDWNGEKLLFVRPGGFGDLLFLTPTFAKIKQLWPAAEIYVACYDRYHVALLNNSDVAGFIPYPVPMEVWNGFGAHIWLENVIESNSKAKFTHAVDLIADRVGLELEDRAMRYFVTEEEKAKAELEYQRFPDRPVRVGIQMTASGSCRIYPFLHDLSVRLWRDLACEVFLMGKPGEIATNQPQGVVNLMLRGGKTFRESCAILQTCDIVVGPDSALVHVAGALDIPCVALYGPFPWKLRTAFAPKTFALQGQCPVSPCFHHARPGTGTFPENGPCSVTGRCEALAAIPVERVMREVEKRVEWKTQTKI